MQARQRDVGRGVRVVDRMHLGAADERLARVELPAEERVHEPRDRHDLPADLRGEEVVRRPGSGGASARPGSKCIAIVSAPIESDRTKTSKPSTDACRCISRSPEASYTACSSSASRDPRDADPLAAVERLHVQRVADLLGDVLEVERQVVARGHVLEASATMVLAARHGRRHLVRHHPRLRHLEPEPDHRAVGGVLLHRLERERVVEQVDVVHQHRLLHPLARDLVPPAEPVDDELVARLRAEVERLVRDPLGAEDVRLALVARRAAAARRAPRRRGASRPRCRAAVRSGAQTRRA